MAVELLLLASPVGVGGVWVLMRRARPTALAGPALFAQLVAASVGLVCAAGAHASAVAVGGIGAALATAWAALIDLTRRGEGPESPDDDGGGGSDGPPQVPGSDGGETREPAWWPEFERAFRAHAAVFAEQATPSRGFGSPPTNRASTDKYLPEALSHRVVRPRWR